MMAVSDISDAPAASNRPYKAGVPGERAPHILDQERKADALDSDIFNLFIDLKPWESAGKSYSSRLPGASAAPPSPRPRRA